MTHEVHEQLELARGQGHDLARPTGLAGGHVDGQVTVHQPLRAAGGGGERALGAAQHGLDPSCELAG